MDEEIVKEFKRHQEMLNEKAKEQSDYTEQLHGKSTADITDLQEAVTDEMYSQINNEILGG